jgi:hypothetical protein
MDFSRYDSTHAVHLIATVEGRKRESIFDPRLGHRSGDPITVEEFLLPTTVRRLRVWQPLFRESERLFSEYWAQHEQAIYDIIYQSIWKKAGRAACWGFGGVGAAAVCAGGFGVGCALGAFIFGAAASVCSETFKG